MPAQHFQQLQVWQKAVELSVCCYGLTQGFPTEERHGLISQIRRSAVSVAANIAEGHARSHTREFLNHLSMARGSLAELETLLIIAQKIHLLSEEQLKSTLAQADEVGRMTAGLRHALEAKLS